MSGKYEISDSLFERARVCEQAEGMTAHAWVCVHKFSIYIRTVGKDSLGFKRREARKLG